MNSRLFAYFAMCWCNNVIDETILQSAVTKGYITDSEKPISLQCLKPHNDIALLLAGLFYANEVRILG